MKLVRYNGGTESYMGCTEPNDLVVGQDYEVLRQEVSDWQTNYILRGVTGRFNSVWFDEVKGQYIAISRMIPEKGERLKCCIIEMKPEYVKLLNCTTSTILEVEYRGNNIYDVETENSIYTIKVG